MDSYRHKLHRMRQAADHFYKTASATVREPSTGQRKWRAIRQASNAIQQSGGFHDRRASSLSVAEFSPEEYLLSHATIIASVDSETPPGEVKTGTLKTASGGEIYRPYEDFYVTPDTSQYVNQNFDSWERQLLLKTYDSFIGSENYQEHIQVPELSKGKVIDAVPRDLGDTIYVDILVATHRRHTQLVKQIKSGHMNTLSMGCQIDFSICSKCGNLAHEESDLCDHIVNNKGGTFVDEDGNERIICELCGHRDQPDSVEFIEASWVADPAFEGAVLQDVLNVDQIDTEKGAQEPSISMSDFSHQVNRTDSTMDDWKPEGLSDEAQTIQDFLATASRDRDRVSYKMASGQASDQGRRAIRSAMRERKVGWGDDDGGDEEDGDDEETNVFEDVVDEMESQVGEMLVDNLEDSLSEAVEGDEEITFDDQTPGEVNRINDSIVQSSEFDDQRQWSRVVKRVRDTRSSQWIRSRSRQDGPVAGRQGRRKSAQRSRYAMLEEALIKLGHRRPDLRDPIMRILDLVTA